MTTFYLIRHGTNDFVSKALVGRRPGVHLNEAGRAEADRLAEHLQGEGIQQVFTSPMERCRETAAALTMKLGLDLQVLEALNEVQFGDWTGLEIAALNESDLWKQWNTFRTGVRIPNGESIIEVQSRLVTAIDALRRKFSGGRIALVSHGDPLRTAICFYIGMPLDLIPRIEISPGSVSILEIDDWGARLRSMNVIGR